MWSKERRVLCSWKRGQTDADPTAKKNGKQRNLVQGEGRREMRKTVVAMGGEAFLHGRHGRDLKESTTAALAARSPSREPRKTPKKKHPIERTR